jgi:transcriptional regulator GlxA family with amidase domain
MAERWTVDRLAAAVSLSRSQLTRTFTAHVGASPLRFLTEIRLTEFTRLVEETDLPIGVAARQVGWEDSRVAAAWFRRRYGISPSLYRRNPHPIASVTTADR